MNFVKLHPPVIGWYFSAETPWNLRLLSPKVWTGPHKSFRVIFVPVLHFYCNLAGAEVEQLLALN